jgi:hypothetical protein
VKLPILMVSGSFYLESSSSFSQKNLKPPSPPVLTQRKAMSTLSPSQEFKQFIGFVRLIDGGSLLAFIGILNELSSVTNVMMSSKSAKLGAEKAILMLRLIPGAISPVTLLGNLKYFIVKFSVVGGMNFMRFETPLTLVIFKGISYTPLT